MNDIDWIAMLGMAVTLLLNLAGYLVAWGVLKGTVKSLGDRVGSLEDDSGAAADLRVQVARVETRLDALLEQFRDLNAAIRWMRADTPALEPGPLPGVAGPRRGRAS